MTLMPRTQPLSVITEKRKKTTLFFIIHDLKMLHGQRRGKDHSTDDLARKHFVPVVAFEGEEKYVDPHV